MAQAKRMMKLLPNQIPNALQQAVKLQQRGQSGQAKQVLLNVLQTHPKNLDALNLLGVQAALVKDNQTARKFFEKARKIKPNDVKVLINIAKVEYQLKDYKKALVHLIKANKIAPKSAAVWSLLGRTHHELGNLEGALECTTRAVELEPENTGCWLTQANFLVDAGRIDEARKIYRSIASKKDNYEVGALVGIANVTKFTVDDEEPNRLAALANDRAVSTYHGAELLYAAGKASADRKNYDTAFKFYKTAKDKFEKKFESDKHHIYCNSIKTAFSGSYFEALSYQGNASEKPVFIVGMPRSGTTLTEQILASHTDVTGAGEQNYFRNMFAKFGIFEGDPKKFAKTISKLSEHELDKLGKEFLEILDRYSTSAARVVDKMPLNFECLGLIATLFPNAKIIHCTRDPIDTCLSCYMNKFAGSHSYNNQLETLGRYYREYKDLMAYWEQVLPIEIYESSYESLTSNQERDTRKLVSFLGLEWDPACLDFNSNTQLVKTPSKWQVRQPIYKSSVKKWKNYEKHLDPLIDELGEWADTK